MDFNQIISVLKNGGVVTHPTDTCYGLACDPFNEDALRKLRALKGMPDDKPITIMVSDMGEAQKYGVFSRKAFEIGSEGWPGDLTLILSRVDGDGTVGIRVPGDDFTLEMLKRFGGPLTTTSANLHGEKPPYSAEESLKGDYVVDFGRIPENKPSRIVRVMGDSIEMIRE